MSTATALFVANCTMQEHVFIYHLAEVRNESMITIPPGEQRRITGIRTSIDVDNIIAHHSRYGLRSVVEVGRIVGSAPLIYSLDKPLSPIRIVEQMKLNQQVLNRQGEEFRRAAAVQTHDWVGKKMQDMRLPGTVDEVEMAVNEEDRGRNASDEIRPVSDSTRVSRHFDPSEITPTPQPLSKVRRGRIARARA